MQTSIIPLFRLTVLIFVLFLSSLHAENRAHAGPFKNYSSYGAEVDREHNRKKRKSCSNYYYCGPTSTIELSMHTLGDFADDTLGMTGYDIGENGTFEQMLQMGEDYKKGGMVAPILERIKKTAAADEGQKIKIVIPMIDYGYSGTFSNILIKTSKSEDTYQTLKRNRYGDHIGFTGSVTIEEYSPFVMKGSYSGPIYRYEFESGKDYRGPAWERQPVKRVVTGTLSGKFNILSPWRGDDRINETIDHQSAVVDPMKNDIKRLAARYGIDIDVDKEFEKVDVNNRNNSRSGSSTGGSVYGDCNCSCNFVQTATPKCKTVCSDAFKVCKGERYSPPVIAQTPIDRNILALPKEGVRLGFLLKDGEKFMNLNQDIINALEADKTKLPANARARYQAKLQRDFTKPEEKPYVDMMMRAFDESNEKEKKFLMQIAGIGIVPPSKKTMPAPHTPGNALDLLQKDDQELMKLAQDIANALEGNQSSLPANARARYRAKLQETIPGPATKHVRDMLMENFDAASDKEKKIIMKMIGVDE